MYSVSVHGRRSSILSGVPSRTFGVFDAMIADTGVFHAGYGGECLYFVGLEPGKMVR